MAFTFRNSAKTLAALIAAPAIALGLYMGWIYSNGNFHEVIAGELYRSGQPDVEDLTRFRHELGIKTVINLRGFGHETWEEQNAAAAQQGLTMIDFSMDSAEDLTVEETARLIAIMKDAPKPLLIHCKRGADRTGLASALYLEDISGKAMSVADEQLSIWYGHFGLMGLSPSYAMDRTLRDWRAHRSIAANDIPSSESIR